MLVPQLSCVPPLKRTLTLYFYHRVTVRKKTWFFCGYSPWKLKYERSISLISVSELKERVHVCVDVSSHIQNFLFCEKASKSQPLPPPIFLPFIKVIWWNKGLQTVALWFGDVRIVQAANSQQLSERHSCLMSPTHLLLRARCGKMTHHSPDMILPTLSGAHVKSLTL